MRVIAILALFAVVYVASALASGHSAEEQIFVQWMQEHTKSYATEEFGHRWAVWRDNHRYIEAHNRQPNKTFTLAMNQFGDLTDHEFRQLYLGQHISSNIEKKETKTKIDTTEANTAGLPANFDWGWKGAVSPIKDQGSCGAGWAFAAAAATESANFLKGGRRLVSLSEQNLIDCSSGRPYGNSGCSGGSADRAFEYIINNRGVDTEASYPYQAALGVCRYNATNAGGSIVNYTQTTSGDDNSLLQAVAAQPVAVGFDASDPAFRWYSGGVYGGGACSTTRLNHAMAVVGWGVEVASTYHLTYWTVKNSWGTSWGEHGFVRVSRGSGDNTCGIATAASYPSA